MTAREPMGTPDYRSARLPNRNAVRDGRAAEYPGWGHGPWTVAAAAAPLSSNKTMPPNGDDNPVTASRYRSTNDPSFRSMGFPGDSWPRTCSGSAFLPTTPSTPISPGG